MGALNSIRILSRTETGFPDDPEGSFDGIRLTIPFTTPEAARDALRAAATLASGIAVRATLIAVQVMPFPSELAPDSRTAHLEEQLGRVASESHITVSPIVVLARDRDQAYAKILPPAALVLISAPRKWFCPEVRMARRLLRAGYNVVVTRP